MKSKLLIIIMALFLLSGCSSDDIGDINSGDSISISGQLSNDIQALSNSTIDDVDEVWAFPLEFYSSGRADINFISKKEVFPVNEEGKFTIAVDKLNDNRQYVFVLANSKANIEEQIVYFLAVKSGDKGNLNSFVINDLEKDINLGQISYNGNEAVSENNIIDISDSFISISQNDLKEMAIADNVVKALKNHFINYHKYETPFTGYYDYQLDLGKLVEDEYTGIFKLSEEEYRFSFWTKRVSEQEFERILLSPNDSSYNINPAHPEGRIYITKNTINEDMMEGTWYFQEKDGENISQYDFDINNPIDENGYLSGFTPTFRINTNEEGLIDSISLKWYINEGNGNFEEVNNLNIIDENIRGAFIQFNGGDSNENGGNWQFDVTKSEIYIPSRYGDVYFNELDKIKLDFGIMGSKYELYLSK